MNNWDFLYILITLPENEFNDYLSDTDTIINVNNDYYNDDYDDNDNYDLIEL
jgi:hypothetical protein